MQIPLKKSQMELAGGVLEKSDGRDIVLHFALSTSVFLKKSFTMRNAGNAYSIFSKDKNKHIRKEINYKKK